MSRTKKIKPRKERNWTAVHAHNRKGGAHKLDSEKRIGNNVCVRCGDEAKGGLCDDCYYLATDDE